MITQKTTVIIPAAGKATRMRPLSTATSKAMLPVNGIPIIARILNHLKEYNSIEEIIIVENQSQDIRAFCQHSYKKQVDSGFIKFIVQEDPQGPLHAIQVGASIAKEGTSILIWLGDTLCEEDFSLIIPSWILASPVKDKWRWCLVSEDGKTFYDKPDTDVPTDLALIGIYFFSNRKEFDSNLKEAMSGEKIKNEYQISSLLDLTKSIRVIKTDKWYDCGELKSYYESKAKLLSATSRDMNKISVDTKLGIVTKYAIGNGSYKIENEKKWYDSLTDIQRMFVPKILKSEHGILKMSWEAATPLNEMWLYENMRSETWYEIYDKILDTYFSYFAVEKTELVDLHYDYLKECYTMYIDKNMQRLDVYGSMPDFAKVREFVYRVGLRAMSQVRWADTIHGDFHMGNTLFNPTNGDIKFVDPRGKFGNHEGSEGDTQYDMAKLLHDWYGGYMQILSGKYDMNETTCDVTMLWDNSKVNDVLRYLYKKLREQNYDWNLICDMSIVLLFTCLPFHEDDHRRQKAFWNRGLQLLNSRFTRNYD